MSLKKYSKTKLASFKKSIESKINNVADELGDIKESLD